MVDFPQRAEAARRNVREIVGTSAYNGVGLDDWPVMVRPVIGQPPANDPLYNGENLDFLINQFITRLRTPGAQVSAPVLHTLVAAVTEMVSALTQQSQVSTSPPQAPLRSPSYQAWAPSAGQGNAYPGPLQAAPSMFGQESTSSAQSLYGNIPGGLANTFAEAGYIPAQGGWTAQEQISGFTNPQANEAAYGWESAGYPAFGGNENYFYSPVNGAEDFAPQNIAFGSAIPEPVVAGEEDKLAPIQGIKREFVPQGIPVSFFANEEEDSAEVEPSLFDFISNLHEAHSSAYF